MFDVIQTDRESRCEGNGHTIQKGEKKLRFVRYYGSASPYATICLKHLGEILREADVTAEDLGLK